MSRPDPTDEYRRMFDEDSRGRIVADRDWRILEANPAMSRMLGFRANADLVGRCLTDFSQDPLILQKLLAVVRGEGRAGPVELQMQQVDRAPIHVSCSVAGTGDASGALASVRAEIVEIADSKGHQAGTLGAGRMEAIGRLAGGLAHDFNNLLTVIGCHGDRLSETLPSDHPLSGSVEAIRQASARAAFLTRQLLAFSRRQVFELRPVSVNRLVMDSRPALAQILGERIALRVEVPPVLPEIRADAQQIERVIANLTLNAREAMPGGGNLTIRVDTVDIAVPAPKERPWIRPGQYVRLVVADTGHGMDPVTKAYAFQPFFTTKPIGNGTGLGLATVYGIVKQSNGFVWVDSRSGEGAVFTLLFPVSVPGTSGDEAERHGAGPETILLVEQDERARAFVSDALRRRGYPVLDAPSAAAALDVFARYPSRIHLLLCNAESATAGGTPLGLRLKSIDPSIQSLVMIGAGNPGATGGQAAPGTPTIQKPFTLLSLADRVRQVLDSGEGRA